MQYTYNIQSSRASTRENRMEHTLTQAPFRLEADEGAKEIGEAEAQDIRAREQKVGNYLIHLLFGLIFNR